MSAGGMASHYDVSAIIQTFRERPHQPERLITRLRASSPLSVQVLCIGCWSCLPLGAAVYEGVRVGEDARADERGEADEEEERRKEAGKELAVNVVKIALHAVNSPAARRTFKW